MLSTTEIAGSLSSGSQLTGSQVRLVEDALDRILVSPPFRSSRQCQDLLKYVVRHSLADQNNLLRERVIGNAVFGRSPDYDTANDPVVRARMAEVRKRLAQYYQGADDGVQIEILPGHYVAQFRFSAEPVPVQPSMAAEVEPEVPSAAPLLPPVSIQGFQPGRSWKKLPGAVTLVALLIIVAGFLFVRDRKPQPQPPTAFDQFWQPAMRDSMPVIIYTGTNVVYRLSPEFLDRYRRTHHLKDTGPEVSIDLNSAGALSARDLQEADNTYVTTRDVAACSAIVAMLVRHGKPYELRFAGDISPGDLRTAPVVLIGAFNNNWTLAVTNPLRFTFARGTTILDNVDKSRSWTIHFRPDGATTDDYAIISRLTDPATGEVMMVAAGIGHYGTEAASDFLTNPRKIDAFARTAPHGWAQKNLQIVMHVKVVDDAPAATDIVAVYTW